MVSVEIDHFKPGYILTWSRKFDGLLIERSYSFDLVSTLAYTHEQRFSNDTLISQGFVHYKGDTLDYISQAITKKHSLEFKVEEYSYEVYKNGALSCVYNTKHRNHYEMLFEKRPDKVELVKGDDCLSIIK